MKEVINTPKRNKIVDAILIISFLIMLVVIFREDEIKELQEQEPTVYQQQGLEELTLKEEEQYLEESMYTENIRQVDSSGNVYVIPKGFELSKESGANISEGIVIEDIEHNQYVWIPVGTNLVKSDGTRIGIELGRYEFSENGTYTLNEDEMYYEETLDINRNKGNVISNDIEKFIESVRLNGGFYIGRYEAGSGINTYIVQKDQEPYGDVTQKEAAVIAKTKYDSEYFTVDLINSYAWDTAIVYIQEFGENSNSSNYSNQHSLVQGERLLTGEALDEQLKINDMAGNVYEWTTETSEKEVEFSEFTIINPCVYRGGVYKDTIRIASKRTYSITTHKCSYLGFRPVMYLENK